MSITAQQVQAVLTQVVSDQIVDVPAKHDKRGYWIEIQELTHSFESNTEEWYESIANAIG